MPGRGANAAAIPIPGKPATPGVRPRALTRPAAAFFWASNAFLAANLLVTSGGCAHPGVTPQARTANARTTLVNTTDFRVVMLSLLFLFASVGCVGFPSRKIGVVIRTSSDTGSILLRIASNYQAFLVAGRNRSIQKRETTSRFNKYIWIRQYHGNNPSFLRNIG